MNDFSKKAHEEVKKAMHKLKKTQLKPSKSKKKVKGSKQTTTINFNKVKKVKKVSIKKK